jgi:glutathione S-transferase
MLELPDGRVLGQSSTICEYLARKFDLIGNNEFGKRKETFP